MRLTPDEFTIEALCDQARETDPFSIFSEDPEGTKAQILEALSGRHDTWRERLANDLATHDDPLVISAATAALLVHLGVDPVAVCLMGSMASGVNLLEDDPDQDEDDPAVSFDMDNFGSVRLAPGVRWDVARGVTIRDLPETVADTIGTGPLRDVVAHPVLDALDLKITDVAREVDSVVLAVDVDRRALTVDQLLGHRPIHGELKP